MALYHTYVMLVLRVSEIVTNITQTLESILCSLFTLSPKHNVQEISHDAKTYK